MAKANVARVRRLVGIRALEHASRTGAQLMRHWSLLSLGGAVDLEDAFRIARDSNPDLLYADVAIDELPAEEVSEEG
jgi:hypothetical protein